MLCVNWHFTSPCAERAFVLVQLFLVSFQPAQRHTDSEPCIREGILLHAFITKLSTIPYKMLHNNHSHAPVMSKDWWEHSLEGGKELAWEKGAGKGRADYFKDRMWAGGSKHADSTWCEIYSRILAAWRSRWKRDFSLLRDISDN